MIFIYDRNEKQIAHLDIVPTITEEIGKLRVLEFESEEEFEKGYRVVANTNDGVFEFIIIDSDYSRDDMKVFSYFCQDSLIETQSIPILDKRPWGNVEVVSKAIFGDTRWVIEVRNGYNMSTVLKNSYYHITVLEAFSDMVEKYRAEWITEFKVVGSEITERRVVLYQRDGRSKGRLEFGKNITKFERKILSEPIITALYVHGKGEDLGNGTYGRRISISSVNKGKDYIENTEATKKYGLGKKGQKKALFGFVIFEEEADPTNLLKLGKQELEILSQVRAEYTVNAINLDIDAKIGYEVAVIDEEIGYRGYSRIIKIVRQGDDIELTFGTVTKKFVDSVQKTLKRNEQNINNAFVEINNVRTSADGKTGVFTGASKPKSANNGDWWYRYNPDGTVSMLIYKDGEWVDELTDRLFKDVNLKIEQAQQSADKASEDIEEKAKAIQEEIKTTNADTIKQLEEYKTTNNQSVDVIKNDILGVNQKLDTKASIDEVQKDLSNFDEKLKTKADSKAVVDVRKTVDGIQGSIKETNAKVENLNEFKKTAEGNFQKLTEIQKDLSTGETFQKIQSIEETANGNKRTIALVGDNVNEFNQTISEVNLELSRIGKKTAGTDALYNELKRTVDETSSIISDPTRKDLLSAINQKAGQVLIQAGDSDGKSRLMVTKENTFIDKGVIQTAHIANGAITNAKIKDASITSAKILSLDVHKINGDISNFVKSNWNAINSSVRIDGKGMYIDGDWGGAINFTRRGLTYYDKIKGQVMGYQYGLYRNQDDPRQKELMQGIFLGAELGYNLKLGIRTEKYNQNTTFLEINGLDKHTAKGTVYGELEMKKNLILNDNSIIIKGNSGVRFGVGKILGNTVTYMVNVQGTAGIGFTMGGGIVVRRYDKGANAPIWKWL